MILLRQDIQQNQAMTTEQMASLQPALAKLLGQFRHCFQRDKTFAYLEKNEFRKEIVRELTVAPGRSVVVVRLDQAGIRAFRREHILFATLTDKSGGVLARANAPADIERRLTFPDAELDVGVKNGDLVITTDKFARCVTLEGEDDPFGWFFEENYFDLLPGETKVVRILGQHPEGHVTAKAWYSPHVATVAWRRP